MNLKPKLNVDISTLSIDQDTVLKRVAEMTIQAQILNNNIHELRFAPKVYQKDLKRQLNIVIPKLNKIEIEYYDNIFNQAEDASKELYIVTERLGKLIVKLGMENYGNICDTLEAMIKDSKSIEGVVKKINKHK